MNWNNGKLDYSELASIIHQYCSAKHCILQKKLEKCKISLLYLCKDLANIDDHGCPKAYNRLENDDADDNCSNYPYRHKKTFHCAEKKAYVYRISTLIFLIICNLLFSLVIFSSETRVLLENELIKNI